MADGRWLMALFSPLHPLTHSPTHPPTHPSPHSCHTIPCMDALAFLERGDKAKILPLMVLHGDESFLKREALQLIRRRVLGDAEDGEASVHAGDKATFAAVCDELE